jgi:hypothetical protein
LNKAIIFEPNKFFKQLKKNVFSFGVILLVLLAIGGSYSFTQKAKKPKVKKVIFIIGDGMGLAQISGAMSESTDRNAFERFKVIGMSKTSSADNYVTDSGAGATVFARMKNLLETQQQMLDVTEVEYETIYKGADDLLLSYNWYSEEYILYHEMEISDGESIEVYCVKVFQSKEILDCMEFIKKFYEKEEDW